LKTKLEALHHRCSEEFYRYRGLRGEISNEKVTEHNNTQQLEVEDARHPWTTTALV